MDERDDLTLRAEVLTKLADQLSAQLAVERRANDELRAILSEGPTVSVRRDDDAATVAPLATTLAAVAVGMSICASVATSWLSGHEGGTCAVSISPPPPAAIVAAPVQASMASLELTPPTVRAPPVTRLPSPIESVKVQRLAPASDYPRECGPVVDRGSARCVIGLTRDHAASERTLRALILAHTLVGERAQARRLASRYAEDFAASPFRLQVQQIVGGRSRSVSTGSDGWL